MVARGEVDLYLNDYLVYSDWDLCAGHILVEEAGGRMTDRDGHELTYGASSTTKSRGFLAGNGIMHGEALQIVRSGEV